MRARPSAPRRVAGVVEGPDACRRLHSLTAWARLPEHVEAQIAWLDDEYALRLADVRLDPDASLRALLAEHLPGAQEFTEVAELVGLTLDSPP